jgi:hypothetical protein
MGKERSRTQPAERDKNRRQGSKYGDRGKCRVGVRGRERDRDRERDRGRCRDTSRSRDRDRGRHRSSGLDRGRYKG